LVQVGETFDEYRRDSMFKPLSAPVGGYVVFPDKVLLYLFLRDQRVVLQDLPNFVLLGFRSLAGFVLLQYLGGISTPRPTGQPTRLRGHQLVAGAIANYRVNREQ
jgi:hypothetical protein